MNKRINELIKEAGISTADYYRNQDDPCCLYSKGIVSEWSEETKQKFNLTPAVRIKEMDEDNLQKFAHLIVLECINVFSKDLPDPTSADYKLGSLVEVTDRICKVVEHFGVEE